MARSETPRQLSMWVYVYEADDNQDFEAAQK